MDTSTSWGSGYWILLMKGARGTSNFGYTSNLFTSNSTVLNESSPARDFVSDAKYHAYNNISLSQMLAVISSPERGSISNQGDIANNNFGGHTWLETVANETAFARLTTYRSLNTTDNLAFSSVPVQKYRQSNSNGSTQVFSYQTGTGRYGHAVECAANGYKARWGIIWNNETNQLGSCDAFVGIGAQYGTDTSPRDQVTWNDSQTVPAPSANNNGGLGQFAFQIWGKMATPSQTAPAQPTVVNAALGAVTVSWTAPAGSPTNYVVQYKLTSDSSWGTNPSQSVVVSSGTSTTITGLSNSTSYDFRVVARTSTNSSLPSTVRTHTITPRTISFNSNGGTGTMATMDVADSVSTTLPANTFTRDRYTFRGWNTAANGTGTNHTDGANLSAVGANVTLYAMWTSLDDLAWDKNNTNAGYAFLNDAGNPVMPTGSNQAWTLEAWVQPDSTVGWIPILGQQNALDTSTGRNNIWLNEGQVILATSADTLTGVFLSKDRWTHIAWVMSTTSSAELYVDGNLAWAGTTPRVTGGPFFTVGGSRQGGTGQSSFDGQIDQVKVWGAALTSTQVANSMHTHGSAFSGTPSASCTTGLRAHYDFNEFVTGTVLDRSGCGKNLAFNIAASGGSFAESDFKSSEIVETSTAHSLQTYYKFNRSYLTASGGWTPPAGVTKFKTLVLAGGGGGGGGHDTAHGGGGGGAGGLLQPILNYSSGALKVQVGTGGFGGEGRKQGKQGGNTILGETISAIGGGGGGAYYPNDPCVSSCGGGATSGGSGGGAGAGQVQTGAIGTAGQGFSGGNSGPSTNVSYGAGGGGAGDRGLDNYNFGPGAGGIGVQLSITGTPTYFAGGGGGGSINTVTGVGGLGGGGNGSSTAAAHPYQLPEPQTPAVVAVVVRDLPAYHKPALQVDQELWFFLTDLF
jgi:uncharacterized repeat protein (TIGR02543 family)